jgi:phosphatidylserine/phosphatidylglycerophosphate/cardiolipin synthase-like enzyme
LLALLLLFLPSGCDPIATDDDDGPPPDIELACDRDYYPTVRAVIEAAQERIDVAQWEFFSSTSTNRLVAILNNAVERGVDVRVLLDESVEQNETALQLFAAYGIEASLDSSTNRNVHVKMLVADGSNAVIGSTNWSSAALDDNRECNLVLRAGKAPHYFDAWFAQLWADSGGRDSPELDQGQGVPGLGLINDDLLPHLLARIEEASEAIDFTLYATYLQPNNLSAPAMQVFSALADASARGLPVRGVADFTDWNPENNESNQEAVSWLRDRGVTMRWDDPDSNMHAKTFRIDGGLQVQSANVSSGGLAQNHEAGAWTDDAQVLQDWQEWFDGLWEESTHIHP